MSCLVMPFAVPLLPRKMYRQRELAHVESKGYSVEFSHFLRWMQRLGVGWNARRNALSREPGIVDHPPER